MNHRPLYFYNTLSRQKEEFQPINPEIVGLYSCGPTVYNYAHIGNMRSYFLSDLVRKTLEINGYTVKQIINITDVGHLTGDTDNGEDKVEKAARENETTVDEITNQYEAAFFADLESFNINTVRTEFPRASKHIAEQINIIKILEDKGFTYKTSDGIYFDTTKYPAYKELAKLNIAGQQEGARIEINNEKLNSTDFALWKFSKSDETRLQEWESPWGVGFPGWHIECSAMSIKYLGEHFDIHTGGEDHIPVHHTNERAQSECATGQTFVNYWLHNAFITVDGKKMAKSENNFYTLSDLTERGYSPLAYRYLLLGAHYRSPLNFTLESLGAAQKTWHKINEQVFSLPQGGEVVDKNYEDFITALNDDLNTAKALATVHEILNSSLSPADKRATLEKCDEVLGILDNSFAEQDEIPEEVVSLAQDREVARERGDWTRADLIRAQIEAKGYSVKDTADGPQLRHL